MQRDPMDELIDDLDRIVPAKQPTEWGQMPSLEEIHRWTDVVLYSRPLTKADLDGTAKPVKEDYEDDPGFQDHMRKWREWKMRLELEAKETPTSDTPSPNGSVRGHKPHEGILAVGGVTGPRVRSGSPSVELPTPVNSKTKLPPH